MMTYTLMIENDCLPMALRAGAELACAGGTLWLTLEGARPRRSPDIVLEAGQRHRVTEDATYFLTALGHGAVTVCRVSAPPALPTPPTPPLRPRWRWRSLPLR
ncbi:MULTISPECIES: DUF2917 domain-containing protein [Cupriavidus]|uniref:DUF2917 domain-containing protein n=2 Tax=Cupriavidus campinensis TaxID=151783 RepID=A0AAE9L4V9_9BURK|nr:MULTISPECIES: DUF2917 domain-containing protein [Cupriavidus]URF06869.1 DUF2917 domain-containing protein [Cupriavidus campinensis]